MHFLPGRERAFCLNPPCAQEPQQLKVIVQAGSSAEPVSNISDNLAKRKKGFPSSSKCSPINKDILGGAATISVYEDADGAYWLEVQHDGESALFETLFEDNI